MKVLLVYPVPPKRHWPFGIFRSMWIPSGLSSLAGVLLRDGHDVRVHMREEHLMKCNFDWPTADAALKDLLREFRPEMVGLSMVTPAVEDAGAIAAWAKEIVGPHVITVAGGPHPTAVPELTLRDCPAVDAVAVGEAEMTLVEIARNGLSTAVAGIVMRGGKMGTDSLLSLEGRGCREAAGEGEFVRTPPRQPIQDLDSLPPTPYELFDMAHYNQLSRGLIPYIPLRATNLRTSRGCTNRCRFCGGHIVSGIGVRMHGVARIIDQMTHAAGKLGVEAVHFEDDTIGASASRLAELCKAIRAAGLDKKLKWDCCLRVDQAQAELLREMKASGCIQVEYGFESGSDAALKRLGKNATVEQNRRAVELTRAAGLRIFADMMLGLPGETAAEARATLKFLRWSRPEVIGCSRLCPLPGTPIYDGLPAAVRESIDWGDYAYLDKPGFKINLTAMSDRKFDRLYRRCTRYFIQPAVGQTMLLDTPDELPEDRRRLRSRLRRFIIRHPLAALRVPWRRR